MRHYLDPIAIAKETATRNEDGSVCAFALNSARHIIAAFRSRKVVVLLSQRIPIASIFKTKLFETVRKFSLWHRFSHTKFIEAGGKYFLNVEIEAWKKNDLIAHLYWLRVAPNVSCHIKMSAEPFYLYYFFNLEPFVVNGIRFTREVATVRFTDACAFSTILRPQIDVCIVDNMIFWPEAEKT